MDKETKEERKFYFKIRDKRAIPLRLSANEQALLFAEMQEEDWENISGFIKYKLFGIDSETKGKNRLKLKDKTYMGWYLQRTVLELVDKYDFIIHRYNNDMLELYNEEKIEAQKWISVTARYYSELTETTKEHMKRISEMANALGLEDYFKMPSMMNYDSEEFDNGDNYPIGSEKYKRFQEYANQVRKEQIALGLTDGKPE